MPARALLSRPNTQTSQKRRREPDENDAQDDPSADQPRRSKSTKMTTMPPRRVLQLLESANPGIPRRLHRDSARPSLFLEVRAALSTNIGVGVIPSSLRKTIVEHHTEDPLTTPEYVYSDEKTTAHRRSSRLWETVLDLWSHAHRCANPTGDENTWCRLVDHILSVSVSSSTLLRINSVCVYPVPFPIASANQRARQSQSFAEQLLPELPFGILNRKIDYCLTPSFDNQEFRPVYKFLNSNMNHQIGLMNDDVTENLPVLFAVEVKRTNGDIDDAEVQLKTCFYAFFKRLEGHEVFLGRQANLAALGVVVHGHTWVPYAACRNGTQLVRMSCSFCLVAK